MEMSITEFQNVLSSLVIGGYIPMERIDDAVSRILLVKFNMGIFEEPLADVSLVSELGSKVTNFFYTFICSFIEEKLLK